jgi:salicylate hydroxylase
MPVDTGKVIGCLEWKEDVLQETGADYLVIRVSLYLRSILEDVHSAFWMPIAVS